MSDSDGSSALSSAPNSPVKSTAARAGVGGAGVDVSTNMNQDTAGPSTSTQLSNARGNGRAQGKGKGKGTDGASPQGAVVGKGGKRKASMAAAAATDTASGSTDRRSSTASTSAVPARRQSPRKRSKVKDGDLPPPELVPAHHDLETGASESGKGGEGTSGGAGRIPKVTLRLGGGKAAAQTEDPSSSNPLKGPVSTDPVKQLKDQKKGKSAVIQAPPTPPGPTVEPSPIADSSAAAVAGSSKMTGARAKGTAQSKALTGTTGKKRKTNRVVTSDDEEEGEAGSEAVAGEQTVATARTGSEKMDIDPPAPSVLEAGTSDGVTGVKQEDQAKVKGKGKGKGSKGVGAAVPTSEAQSVQVDPTLANKKGTDGVNPSDQDQSSVGNAHAGEGKLDKAAPAKSKAKKDKKGRDGTPVDSGRGTPTTEGLGAHAGGKAGPKKSVAINAIPKKSREGSGTPSGESSVPGKSNSTPRHIQASNPSATGGEVSGSTQKKVSTQPPIKKNPISASTGMSLLQQTLASLQGSSTPKRDTERTPKRQEEKVKKSHKWGEDYTPNAAQRAELEANRPERERQRAIRAQWKENAINLQEARDAYRLDALREREIKLPRPMGIIPEPETMPSTIVRKLLGMDPE